MNKSSAIYTEKNNCQDCYKCVKYCPVKAIKLEDSSASVIPELCIYCGKCTQVCPANAKKIRDDIPKVVQALQNEKIIVCILPVLFLFYELAKIAIFFLFFFSFYLNIFWKAISSV